MCTCVQWQSVIRICMCACVNGALTRFFSPFFSCPSFAATLHTHNSNRCVCVDVRALMREEREREREREKKREKEKM